MRERELLADLGTRRVARLGGSGEADPGPDEQRFDGRDGDVERDGQLGVAEIAQLAHQQRGALLFGQAPDVFDQAAQLLALLRDRERVSGGSGGQLEQFRGRQRRPAELVDAAVVGDAVKPGAQRELAVARAQPTVGAHEHILERVLGVLARARQHLAHVREQPLAVAVVDDREGLVVSGSEGGHELVVGTEPREGQTDRDPPVGECRWSLERRRFHVYPWPL